MEEAQENNVNHQEARSGTTDESSDDQVVPIITVPSTDYDSSSSSNSVNSHVVPVLEGLNLADTSEQQDAQENPSVEDSFEEHPAGHNLAPHLFLYFPYYAPHVLLGGQQPQTGSTPPNTSSQVSAHSQPPAPISRGQQAQLGSTPPAPTRSHGYGQSYAAGSSILQPDVQARPPPPPPNPNQRLLVQTANQLLHYPLYDPNYHVEQQFEEQLIQPANLHDAGYFPNYASQSSDRTLYSVAGHVGRAPNGETQPHQTVYVFPGCISPSASAAAGDAQGTNSPLGDLLLDQGSFYLNQLEHGYMHMRFGYRYSYTMHVYEPAPEPPNFVQALSLSRVAQPPRQQDQAVTLADYLASLSNQRGAAAANSSSDGDGANGSANAVPENNA